MNLGNTACALGLYKYDCSKPDGSLFRQFHATITSLFTSYGIIITHFGAEGAGYPDKLTKISGRSYDRMLKSGFADTTGLSLLANPPESTSPTYDSFANAMLNYVEVNRELLLCIVINESFVKIRSREYDELVRSQTGLCRWGFGYGFASSVEKKPDFHILGLDNGKLSAEEYKSLCTWYAAPRDLRAALLRDVYPYNILNDNQLDAQARNGVTLRQIAESHPGCSLTRLAEYGLYMWQVSDAELPHLREMIAGSPVKLSPRKSAEK